MICIWELWEGNKTDRDVPFFARSKRPRHDVASASFRRSCRAMPLLSGVVVVLLMVMMVAVGKTIIEA